MNSVKHRYRKAYATITGLGTEVETKGDPKKELVSGDCISKVARRQSDSLGMIRLVRIPTLTAVSFCSIEPICSTQPPMNARPYRPNTIPPVARAGKAAENISVIVMTTRDSV